MPTDFRHVEFSTINHRGIRRNPTFSRAPNPKTINNLNNRIEHGNLLKNSLNTTRSSWSDYIHQNGLDNFFNENEIPLFLQIDTEKIKIDSLRTFGIELIAEENDGYIIGSSMDIGKLEKKINDFLIENGQSKNQASQLWKIDNGLGWRLEHILSPELSDIWDQINETATYEIEIGVACQKTPEPKRTSRDTNDSFEEKMSDWYRDNYNKQIARESQLGRLVTNYSGEIISQIESEDSFCCAISITGKGLKDIAMTFPYIFEIQMRENIELSIVSTAENNDTERPVIKPPSSQNATVCVIDSGIQEGHVLLNPAIKYANSRNYVPGHINASDLGGHGTKVAGVITYPDGIPRSGIHSLDCWIENAKILNEDCVIPRELMPARLMKQIVEDFHINGTRLFNLSINSSSSYRINHVSSWAAEIDQLIYHEDVLFIISSGNLNESQIRGNFLNYPSYLHENGHRIANPGQSLLGLTIGSICPNGYDTTLEKSISPANHISSFSRIGFGIWDTIKPELVEYGGEYIIDKINPFSLKQREPTSIETTNSTLHSARAYSKESIGTSFAVPKISNMLAKLQNLFPDKTTLFHKALLIQSARWPQGIELIEGDRFGNAKKLARYGYGLPNIDHALQNNPNRITFIDTTKSITCNQTSIYEIHVPEEIRGPSITGQIRIEVTLVYKANPRRTRRGTRSYLSMWMNWIASKPGETMDAFHRRVAQVAGGSQLGTASDSDESLSGIQGTSSFKWTIQNQGNWGMIDQVSRSNSATQKDWMVVNAYELPSSFFIGVIGHNGWEKDPEKDYPYTIAVSFESLDGTIQIYEQMIEVNQVQAEIESLYQ